MGGMTPGPGRTIHGSRRAPLDGARITGRHRGHEVRVTLHLRPAAPAAARDLGRGLEAGLDRRRHLTHDEFARRHAAHASAVSLVTRFARHHGLRVVDANRSTRMVQVAGSVSVVNRAFGVDLLQYERDDVRHHGHAGSVRLPDAVARVVDGVLGLDNRPCGRSYLRPYTAKTTPRAAPPRDLRHYLAPQVARIYGFPPGMDGTGECIAFVELGGGYRRSDLAAYARRANVPVPRVTSVSVDGARNRPTGDAMGDDGEVALDLEVAAAIAPRARLVVYFAPGKPRFDLFYETKSNLRKDQVKLLRAAGVGQIQPGIESFSDSILALMRKGVTGIQNVQLLKWCREFGVHPHWNVLWGFPGESPGEYERLAELAPKLAHLVPPTAADGIRLDRFSPNFFDADRLGFTDVAPLPAYGHFYRLPPEAVSNLAYYFSFRYADGRDPAAYIGGAVREVDKWKRAHTKSDLFVTDDGRTRYHLGLEADRHGTGDGAARRGAPSVRRV